MSNKTTFGYYKVAAASFKVAIGDCAKNAKAMIELIKKASSMRIELIVFPELSVTGYTCADIFINRELLNKATEALFDIAAETSNLPILICVGAPIEDKGKLYNCAVYIQKGKIIGVVPKLYLPNYGEFYEKRWFSSGFNRLSDTIRIGNMVVPFSERLLLRGEGDLIIGTEICEDLWVESPPSGELSLAGANIIVNPSASNELIGKKEYRRNLVKLQSAKCHAGYIYSSSGVGESSTDLVFSGHLIICDNGHLVKEEADIFSDEGFIVGLIDLDRCSHDKRKYNSGVVNNISRTIDVSIEGPIYNDILPEIVNPYPFVPSKEDRLNERCQEILSLQARGLMQRLEATKIDKVVVGISGGLDSTLALLVCCMAFDKLGLSREGIHAITMPGFGTSNKTKSIADSLMDKLEVTSSSIDICKACRVHLEDIGHPMDEYDIAYENTQARERTQILFDYANSIGGLVIGTGDMSEMALGWCTYNGDHMSNYAVNVGVPKTLVKYLVRTYAMSSDDEIKNILMEVFNLPISPELLPTDENGEIAQKTEDSIGKYDIHDFLLYHYLRNGFSREKLYALACVAFKNIDETEIEETVNTFFARFKSQQFKRSCMPDGVKIGTVALSPRGDLRMPSDLAKLS